MVEVDSFSATSVPASIYWPEKLSPQGVCTPGWELLFGEARMVLKITRMSASCQ